MINIGNNEISIMLGDAEIPAIYCGDLQIYPMNYGTLTAITLDNLTWVEDVSYEGGTATSANCSFVVTGYYDSGKTKRLTNQATISGSLVVPATTAETRESVGTLTLTVTYDTFTVTGSVTVYQEAYKECNPIVIYNYLGNMNNAGLSRSGMYCFDSGITEITDCDYDFSGITCICSRVDAFYDTPNACLGAGNTSSDSGCLDTIVTVDISIPTVRYIRYPFGADSTTAVSQSIQNVTFRDTENVTQIRQIFRRCTNLVNVSLGDLSNALSQEQYHFQGCTSLVNLTVDKLPKENITNYYLSDCINLTERSVINILNALQTGNYQITLGSTLLNKLTSAEGQQALANAISRGWRVS